MIDTTEVTRLAGKFTNLLQDYTDIETKANSTYASITDLVSVTKVSGAKFEQQMAKTKKVLSNTNKWMTEFNGKQGKTQAGFNEILSKQKAELASLNNAVATNKSGQVSGIISVGAQKMYQMKDFKKSVKTGHAKVAKLEKRYDNHYHGMKYLWQEYSNTKVGKATSTLVNRNKAVKAKKNVLSGLLSKYYSSNDIIAGKNAKDLIKELKSFGSNTGGKVGKVGRYGKTVYRAGIYINHLKRNFLNQRGATGNIAHMIQKSGKIVSPDTKEKAYDKVERNLDKVYDKTKKVGKNIKKSFSKSWNSIKKVGKKSFGFA